MTRCMRPVRRSRKALWGVALLRASEHLKGLRTKNDDQKTGVEIVRKALSSPARRIAINAGEDGSVIVGKILEKDQYAYGFDSHTGEFINLVSKGIIDPTKVVRVAIQNAASVAALLITTEAMVAEVPKKIVEHCLHHITGDDAEKAYKRGEALKKRRVVMQAFADFAARPPAKVVPMNKKAA